MKSIITLTVNPEVDKNTEVQNVVSERKLRCKDPVRGPGGGSINVSRDMYRLGGQSTAVYSAGGPPGDVLISLLDEEGINQRPVRIKDFTRENLTVYEKESGRQ
jgi:6-phosphofructokinase 2